MNKSERIFARHGGMRSDHDRLGKVMPAGRQLINTAGDFVDPISERFPLDYLGFYKHGNSNSDDLQ